MMTENETEQRLRHAEVWAALLNDPAIAKLRGVHEAGDGPVLPSTCVALKALAMSMMLHEAA